MRGIGSKVSWGLFGLALCLGCTPGGARSPCDPPAYVRACDPCGPGAAPPAARATRDSGIWYVQDYEVEIAQASNVVSVIERNRETGETRTRPLEASDLTSGLTDFIPPSVQLTSPDSVSASANPLFGAEGPDAARRLHLDRQWEAVFERMRHSALPQVETVTFPDNWLEVIAGRRPTDRSADRRTWKRSSLVANTSRLSIGENDDLALEAMNASVRIDGFRARVVLDLFFENDRDQQLEGTFQLRLPDGATPYYLAFGETKLAAPTFTEGLGTSIGDIREQRAETWEAPREARMVPKEKAAYAYTETVRREVDPALLEWAGAGVFEARVFPLQPKKLHRIVIGYETDLLPIGPDLLYSLDLPPDVPDLHVDLTTHGVEARVAPAVAKTNDRYRWHNPDARAIAVHVKCPGAMLLEGQDLQVGAHVAVRLKPALDAEVGDARPRALFLVDVSLSENPERFNLWLGLLEGILQHNRPALSEFAVGFFNIETFWWRDGFQANVPENVAALRAYANQLALEGATDLGQALRSMSALAGPCDVFLLSNGAVTWGEGDLQTLTRLAGEDRPVFAYTTGLAGTDRRVLDRLAQATGGAVFSVGSEAAIPRAATAHRQRPWRIRGVTLDGCRDLMLRGDPRTLYAGQTLVLVGRGRANPDAALELALERDGTASTLEVPIAQRIESPLATSAYGAVAVDRLESLGEAPPDEARAYALHYRVVGQTCSLLMLETDADYERFDIHPEDDAEVVARRPAVLVAEEFVRTREAAQRDPQTRFLRHLELLNTRPEAAVELPQDLRRAMQDLAPAAFTVELEPIRCQDRTWRHVGRALKTEMAAHELTYDVVAKEAEARRRRFGSADGLKVLSSLVEDRPGNLVLARDVGQTAMEWDEAGQAYHVLRRVADKRPYELPLYLSIARCLAGMDKSDLALLYFELALTASRGEHRFGELHEIAGFEYLRFLREIDRGERTTSMPRYVKARVDGLRQELGLQEADLVVVMSWNTDRTDVDLHVVDPTGEECFYSHPTTKMGGRLTRDVTTGYGPEMFVLRKAAPGTYRIKVKNFSSDTLRTGVRSKVYLTMYEDWGRAGERVTHRTVALTETGHVVTLAEIVR